jgi:hypothetical protein
MLWSDSETKKKTESGENNMIAKKIIVSGLFSVAENSLHYGKCEICNCPAMCNDITGRTGLDDIEDTCSVCDECLHSTYYNLNESEGE